MNRKRIILCGTMSIASLFALVPHAKMVHAQLGVPHLRAQLSGHGTTLTWTASPSAAGCSQTSVPPCTFGYNVFRSTTSGGEGATAINPSLILGNTYFDPVTLTNSPQTFFYTVGAQETVGTVTALSLTNSNEVSASFPGAPAPPTGASGSTK